MDSLLEVVIEFIFDGLFFCGNNLVDNAVVKSNDWPKPVKAILSWLLVILWAGTIVLLNIIGIGFIKSYNKVVGIVFIILGVGFLVFSICIIKKTIKDIKSFKNNDRIQKNI